MIQVFVLYVHLTLTRGFTPGLNRWFPPYIATRKYRYRPLLKFVSRLNRFKLQFALYLASEFRRSKDNSVRNITICLVFIWHQTQKSMHFQMTRYHCGVKGDCRQCNVVYDYETVVISERGRPFYRQSQICRSSIPALWGRDLRAFQYLVIMAGLFCAARMLLKWLLAHFN